MKKTIGGDRMFPLGLLSAGEKAEVMEVRGLDIFGSCCPEGSTVLCSSVCRIEDMGLRTGKIVEMLNNEGRGAMLVKIDESRIAIGRGMAMKIMVRKSE